VILREAKDDAAQTSTAWLPHHSFLGDDGEVIGDRHELGHPWPTGWEWILPPIDVRDDAKGPISVVIILKSRRWKPWTVVLQVDPPPRKPQVWAY
jgi:hypothetical protein